MLDFIYSGRLDESLSISEILELYYCAQKYIIEALGKSCLKSLGSHTNQENVLETLKMSYEMSLEDITFYCLFAIKQYMEAGFNFGNHIFLTGNQLPAGLVSFLFHQILDLNDYNGLLCLIRGWTLVECSQRALEPTPDNFSQILLELDLPPAVQEIFAYQDYAFAKSPKTKKFLQRTYHKAARPLIVGDEVMTQSQFSAKNFTTVAGFSLNSRQFTSKQKLDYNQTYTEEVALELLCNENQMRIFSRKFVIKNVEYNETTHIWLTSPVILFPNVEYTLKIKFDGSAAAGCEYPMAVFSNYAQHKSLWITFKEQGGGFLQGSLLNGLICEV